jgi:predicted RNase H-like HicB family nuclease
VAECLDLPVVTQAKTLDALMENVREAIGLALEDENPAIFDLEQDAAKPSFCAKADVGCHNEELFIVGLGGGMGAGSRAPERTVLRRTRSGF